MIKYNREEIEKMLADGCTLHEIGAHYNVSRQRMYQVFELLDLQTPNRTKKRKYGTDPKIKWLSKMLSHKKIHRKDRLKYLEELELPDVCPVLGINLDYTCMLGKRTDNSPSIDQIIPGEGYELDNIIVISWRANRIKNDSTVAELKKLTGFYSNLLTL